MIRLDDYEESEDLTADMVREYATKAGYGLSQAGLRAPNQGGFITFANPMRDDAVLWIIEHLAAREKRSVQSLLREINPRMRAGWPSKEELERHAFWVARNQNTGTVVVGAVKPDAEHGAVLKLHSGFLAKAFADGWSFWPCDQHGNKTRRGA